MEALIRHQQNKDCLHVTNVVISDRTDVAGLTKADTRGDCCCRAFTSIEDREESGLTHEESASFLRLWSRGSYLVRIYAIATPSFVKPWAGRILNIHPSLLPDFPELTLIGTLLQPVLKNQDAQHFVVVAWTQGQLLLRQSEISLMMKFTG